MSDTKIGVQLTLEEIQVLHRALTYCIRKGQEIVPYADTQLKLLEELADVFKRIVAMEEV
jgi:hypothetical protein